MRAYTAVIGGANVDIGGFPDAKAVAGDSNPGRVMKSFGGVGRNIAENLARMGLPVRFLSLTGDDADGRALLKDAGEKGIDTSLCAALPGKRTSTYLFIADAEGDMLIAVNDMGILNELTPDKLSPALPVLNGAAAVVIDANLPEESILYLAENLKAPLFADTVSKAKAPRLLPVLNRLDTLKANRIEAELLTGMSIRSGPDARKASEYLVKKGVRRAFITLGADGAACADENGSLHLKTPPAPLVNATGAGDAFTAALVWKRNATLRECAVAGLAAAACAMGSEGSVGADINIDKLNETIRRIEAWN